MHPSEKVTVTQYSPAALGEMDWVVSPLLHSYVPFPSPEETAVKVPVFVAVPLMKTEHPMESKSMHAEASHPFAAVMVTQWSPPGGT